MKLSQFKFNLPHDLIAMYPPKEREDARMMVLHRDTQTIEHKTFRDILSYCNPGDLFVINNSRVFPARLYGEKEKTGAKIEVMLLRELDPESRLWDVLVDPARKIRIGNKLYFGPNDELVAEVIDNTTSRGRTLRFLFDGPHDEFKKVIMGLGETPLPKVIQRPVEEDDEFNYQTVYATQEGSVAAPTAGMHFSKILMKRMELQDVNFAEVTLHTGMGNFRDIEVEDLTKHKTDSEEINITQETCDLINATKEAKHKVFAVGTTTLKVMETVVSITGKLKPLKGWTNKFIFPPYDFNTADALITNFHLPKSPMMMEVAAFAGYDFLMKAYKEAVAEKYNFFTYGDAMLIL